MAHKATPRRTGVIRKQIARWEYDTVIKVPKGGKIKETVVIHKPPKW
jgi:hypothetical protein